MGDLSTYRPSRLVVISLDARVSLCSDLGFAIYLSEVGQFIFFFCISVSLFQNGSHDSTFRIGLL